MQNFWIVLRQQEEWKVLDFELCCVLVFWEWWNQYLYIVLAQNCDVNRKNKVDNYLENCFGDYVLQSNGI